MVRRPWFIALFAFIFVGRHLTPCWADDDFFESRIRPILFEKCVSCHGEKKQWNSLRIDSPSHLLQGGDSGPAVIPGKPEESLLYRAVLRRGDLQMPPEDPLKPQEIDWIRQWIEEGAEWPKDFSGMGRPQVDPKAHWAFQPVRDSAVPDIAVPVAEQRTTQQPIDAFIDRKRTEVGLTASPEADRRTLLRRVTYDLTGLPPTDGEMEEFVIAAHPMAYEECVDRLLSSPRFGEHMARRWLDVARFSDSKGYVYAREERFFVQASSYRQWVVDAFNRDLPYDRFLLLQLAADQVDPTHIAAMGLMTMGRRFLGVTHDIIDDRIDVVGRGTMGLTIGCARCHDHKYDPIPTSDYYSLYGVFLNSKEQQVPLDARLQSSDSDSAFEIEYRKRKTALQEQLQAKRDIAASRLRERLADYLFAQSELSKHPQEGFDVVLTASDLIPMSVRRWERYLNTIDPQTDPLFSAWFAFSKLSKESFAKEATFVWEQWNQEKRWNGAIAHQFDQPPTSLRDVADRYGRAFHQAYDRWQKSKGSEQTLIDSDLQPLIEFLTATWSPCVVPDEEMVNIEFFFDSDTCVALWKLQGEVDRWVLQAEPRPAVAVGLFDREHLLKSRVFRRGNPATPTDEVTRHFLTMLTDGSVTPFRQGSGRKELAESIIAPENPLTSRVWANRLWMYHFGEGLVTTPSDFGIRALAPSHPELLDHLAVQLMHHGWSTKQLVRSMVLSSTYRQASNDLVPAQAIVAQEKDPNNRWLWRMNPKRLSFEQLRDSMLAQGNRLRLSSTSKPSELLSLATREQPRTLYCQVDRQFLPSVLRVFDFANPDLHIPKRLETIIPQQALFFLNHPFVAVQAKGIVQEIERTSDFPSDEQFIQNLFRLLLQRSPSPQEKESAAIFLKARQSEEIPKARPETLNWKYGYAAITEPLSGPLKFKELPYFSGTAWQGSANYPDAKLGWVQWTATGGHPGNDKNHACVRRWIAPEAMDVAIESIVKHEPEVGDGIACRILDSKGTELSQTLVFHQKIALNVERVHVEKGEHLDFVVDIHQNLNSDQFLWSPRILELSIKSNSTTTRQWDAKLDFAGPPQTHLEPREQLAQVLLASNEWMFID